MLPCFRVASPNTRLKLNQKGRPLRVRRLVSLYALLSSFCTCVMSLPISLLSLNCMNSSGLIITQSSADLDLFPDNERQKSEYDSTFMTVLSAFKACLRHSGERTLGWPGDATRRMISSRNLIRKYFSAVFKSSMALLLCGINNFSVLLSALNHTKPTGKTLTNQRHLWIVQYQWMFGDSGAQPNKEAFQKTQIPTAERRPQ